MAHKQNFANTLEAEAKEAALHGNMRAIYNTTNNYLSKEIWQVIKTSAGKIIQGEEELKNRWKEHFEEILNSPVPIDTSDIQPAEKDLPIKCENVQKKKLKTQ